MGALPPSATKAVTAPTGFDGFCGRWLNLTFIDVFLRIF
jgi:hypothetical protein